MRNWFLVPALACLLAAGGAGARPAAVPSYKLVAKLPGPDGGWDLADVDPRAGRLYVARREGVMGVDLRTGKVTPALVKGARGHAALVIPGTGRVLFTSGDDRTATIFEGASGRVLATLRVGTNPDAAVYDPATRTVWVMNPGSGDISVIDPAGLRVVATVPVGGSLELGAADGRGRLFVNVEDKNEVVVLDTRARKVVGRIPLRGCEGPTGLAYAADAGLIVSACANGVADVVRPDGTAVASLPVGPGADGALYDDRRHLAFIPSGGDGTLSVIRLAPKPAVIASVATATGARTAALDVATGRIYLPSAQYLPAVGTARPAARPGSFAILVVAPVGSGR